MSEVIKMQVVRGVNFTSQVATVMALNGPTGDGLVHLHFFRDVLRPLSQSFEKKDAVGPSGESGYMLVPVESKDDVLEREAVATVSVPIDVLAQLPALIAKHLEKIVTKPA